MPSCTGCSSPADALPITFAFQPIIEAQTNRVSSYEALVRGSNGEPAETILATVDSVNMYAFDKRCRTGAIELAARLGIDTNLNINFLPNAVYTPEVCIQTTLETAERVGFPLDRIIFEISERENSQDRAKLQSIFEAYKRLGFGIAIDDFGAGYSGLDLLADFQPDYIKLDMKLVRDVNIDRKKQAIVRGVVSICRDVGVTVVAEGVETAAEARWLTEEGHVPFLQGYYFARPLFEGLPDVRAVA